MTWGTPPFAATAIARWQMPTARVVVCNMSRKSEFYEKAVMAGYEGTLKHELDHLAHYAMQDEARHVAFEGIEVPCNRQQLHSKPRSQSLVEFEATA